MILLTLEMNGQTIMDSVGSIDWGFVKNTPTIIITDNNHNHNDRYYTKVEIDNRISSLTTSVDGLDEKVANLIQ